MKQQMEESAATGAAAGRGRGQWAGVSPTCSRAAPMRMKVCHSESRSTRGAVWCRCHLDRGAVLRAAAQHEPILVIADSLNRTEFLGDLIAWEDGVYGTSKSVFSGSARTCRPGFVRLTLRAAQCRDAHSTIPLPSASLSA